jgi:hypothetical protein
MQSQILRGDPDLSRAIQQRNWTSFFDAIQETTPEIITRLKDRPFSAFSALASRYKQVSFQTFGAIVCEVSGSPALTVLPLADLAKLICFPDFHKKVNAWPPCAPFWEPALRTEVLELSITMTDWGGSFRNPNGVLHWRVIDAGLETMRTWLQEPESAMRLHWWGITEVIRSSIQLQPFEHVIKLCSWNAPSETEEQFNERINSLTRDIKNWAKEHVREVKKVLVSFDTKRNPEHFHWAAFRLARGLTYPQIADEWASRNPQSGGRFDEGTIRKGVKAVLKSLQLQDLTGNRK